jgi:two-component system, cell cycle sensor histidine kinase and response regulator CckA
MLPGKEYDLILFDYSTGDAETLAFLAELQQAGTAVPFILLTEDADEKTIAEIIQAGAWDCMVKSQLDGANLVRTMRTAIALRSLQQEQRSAESSLRILSRAVEQSDDMVMVVDRNGIIDYVNPAFETLTGYTRDDVRGKTPRILKSGEQGPEVYQELWNTILAGNVFRGILINRTKRGDLLYVEESICPVRDPAGEITHFISNGRDLTERVRMEAQLLQAQKMDAIGRLAGGVAHDFNNLLTIITSYSELAMDDALPGSGIETKIQEILLAARRAAELTRQLLAFSRKQPQALRLVELNQVIGGIAKTLRRLIGEDIEFIFTPGNGLGRVRVDPVQIEQILMNLCANARDAMPQGGRLRIETSRITIDEEYVHNKPAVIPTGHYALITVSDNGSGIPAGDLPHIFEPFYTTKPLGEGTGLGLATVYGIVKQSKGFVWAYSEPHRGTIFKIYLPSTAGDCRVEELAAPTIEQVRRGSETILLVEDESAVRRATAEFLNRQGYTVLEAKDGMDALNVARNYTPAIHLALTDVVMPNVSGGELARQLAGVRPETRLLFVSGYAGKTVLDHDVFDVETNFLQKPFTLKQLSSKIREALDHQVQPAAATLQ